MRRGEAPCLRPWCLAGCLVLLLPCPCASWNCFVCWHVVLGWGHETNGASMQRFFASIGCDLWCMRVWLLACHFLALYLKVTCIIRPTSCA